ncbi:hypothetical protein BC833DRAFT_563769 [Globomyces pollinis-pini]|nr:hypothetical protein BC833DRAFT_563769 [Globomyces pollinis-pini]
MLEMRMDSEQYHIIIMGLAQGGFVEQALDYYHRYIAHGNQPTQSMLDIMMNNVCNLEPEGLINSILFDQPKNAKMVQQYFFQQYQKHGLEPFVGSYTLILMFLNKADQNEFQVVYNHSQKSECDFTRGICTEVYEALVGGNAIRKELLFVFSKDELWRFKSARLSLSDSSVLCAVPNELQTLASYAMYSKEKGLSGESFDLETSIINTRHGIRGVENPTSLESIQYFLMHR